MDVNQKRREGAQGERPDPQTTGARNNSQEEKAPYKTEPGLENVSGIIEECHETADKFKVEHLGELPCPVPSEVELWKLLPNKT